MLKAVTIVGGFVCALSLLAGSAYATPISGTLNITGDVAVGGTTIDWLPVGGGTGTLAVSASSTGSFAPLIGMSGMTKDLNVMTEPVGSPISIADFLTIPGISFTLTQIDPGVFGSGQCGSAPAPGQVCTPPVPPPTSPFNLINTGVGSTASFTVHGTTTVDGQMSSVIGTYTTQFTGETYQQLLATISKGGTVKASYSANFVVTPSGQNVPEPSTAFLVVIGCVGIAAGAFRKRLRA